MNGVANGIILKYVLITIESERRLIYFFNPISVQVVEGTLGSLKSLASDGDEIIVSYRRSQS